MTLPLRFMTALVLALVVIGCRSGAATPSPGGVPTPDELCQLLTPADWAAVGLTTAGPPTIDTDGPGSAYCVYGGTTGGADSLELDVFATASIADATLTLETIKQSIPDLQVVGVRGAQDAVINASIDDSFGVILVRAGRLALTVTAPTSNSITDQLTALATLVLERASGL